MIPCFDQCSLQKEFERRKFFLRIKGFQRLIIEILILRMNDERRMIVLQQEVVHGKSPGAPIPIREGVYVLELCMEICSSRKDMIVRADCSLMDFLK